MDRKIKHSIYSLIYVLTPFVQDHRFPLLRLVHGSDIFNQPYYMDVSRDHLTHITVYIKDHTMVTPSFMPEKVSCTLHLKRID